MKKMKPVNFMVDSDNDQRRKQAAWPIKTMFKYVNLIEQKNREACITKTQKFSILLKWPAKMNE